MRHLQSTLPKNLLDNESYPDVEFVLLDYNSPDGLGEWVQRTMLGPIESGKLIYYRETTVKRFFHAHAKNLAHRLATGDILCNVDADNFTGKGYAAKLAEVFRSNGVNTMITSGYISQCLFGRIAMRKDHFFAIRGYDEDLCYGWGYEDHDLRQRAMKLGLKEVPLIVEEMAALNHTQQSRAKYTGGARNVTLTEQKHRSIVQAKRKRGIWDVNQGRAWGAATVYRNFEAKPIRVG